MTDETRDGRTPDERPIDGLDRLRVAPPPELEDAVVDALADRGWIDRAARRIGAVRAVRPARSSWRAWAMAAAAAGLFLLGVLVGDRAGNDERSPARDAAAGPRFLVLLYEGPGVVQPTTGAKRAAIVEAYVAWSDSVRGAGYALTGEELADPAAGAALSGGAAATDPGPRPRSAGSPDVLAGFHVLGAPDLETALEVAGSHPHLARGGRIVVRPIVEH